MSPDQPTIAQPTVADAAVATPQSDPTPAQAESETVVASLTSEIDDLWSRVEGRTPQPAVPDARTEPDAVPTEPVSEHPKTEAAAQPVDRDAIERDVRQQYENEQQARRDAEARIAAEHKHRQQYEAYTGSQSDYDAVQAALRESLRTGDYSALDDLDVRLPNGKRVSEVKKGMKGLTQDEAAAVLDSWDIARQYENTMGDRKVGQILAMWDAEVVGTLSDPDVDAAAVTKHATPGQQMAALRDSVREAVTKRLTAAHAAEMAARDTTISEQQQRIESLVNERGNLVSQQRAAASATPDRPGQAGAVRRDLPQTAEELRSMSTEDFFKGDVADRLLRAIPGGVTTPPRRRTG